jgi:hypothetical protein
MPFVSSCWRLFGIVAVVSALGLGALGCNVFDGLGSSGRSVDELLADARIAMTNGRPDRAVRLLESAHEKDSTHVEVRIELANALYAAGGVDVFALRAAVEHLAGTGGEAGQPASDAAICTEGPRPARSPEAFVAISFGEAEALRPLVDRRNRLRRVSRLLVDGVLNRRSAAFAALSPEVRATGYVLAAVTRVARRLLAVREAALDTGSTVYVDVRETAASSVVACSPTDPDLRRVERVLCRLGEGIGQSVSWLQARNDLTNSAQTALLIDLLRAYAGALRSRLPCSGATAPQLSDLSSERPSAG